MKVSPHRGGSISLEPCAELTARLEHERGRFQERWLRETRRFEAPVDQGERTLPRKRGETLPAPVRLRAPLACSLARSGHLGPSSGPERDHGAAGRHGAPVPDYVLHPALVIQIRSAD